MTARDLAITFAGGGNRSFYQLGFWNKWGDRLLPRVAAMATCSAGACIATLVASGRADEASAFWKVRRRGVDRNFDWRRLLRGERPAPHGAIYRDTLLTAFAEGGLDRIRAQPFPILVLTTAFPRRIPAMGAVALGLTAYQLEKAARKAMVHPTWGRALGFAPRVFDARACETPEALADLVLASSATPPFTPVGSIAGEPLLDGGVIDNAPAFVAETVPAVRRNLVLLTRAYPASSVGHRGERLYLAPSRPVPVERWDYTRPDLVDATIAQGEEEATLHGAALEAFLEYSTIQKLTIDRSVDIG
jgi:predicted acylesterase/phospholipase RssA